jgi:hypothetical protein
MVLRYANDLTEFKQITFWQIITFKDVRSPYSQCPERADRPSLSREYIRTCTIKSITVLYCGMNVKVFGIYFKYFGLRTTKTYHSFN